MKTADSPALSVIIPTYNRLPYLKEALASFLNQLTCSYEVLIMDDGSTDGTAEYIAALPPPVRAYISPHQGVQAARNLAMQHAQGRYLKFLDDDDVLEPAAVDAQVDYLDQHPDIGLAYADWGFLARTAQGIDRRWFYTMHQISDPIAYLTMDWWCPPFVYLFRRTCLEGLTWDTSFRVLTDFVFVAEVALNGTQFGYVPTTPLPLGWYRAIVPRSQRLSTRASNVERAQHETIILNRIRDRLRQANALTEPRIDALAARYFKIARRVFPDDQALFRQLVQESLALKPTFKAEGRRYQQIIRWFGYAAAERARRFSLRVRAQLKTRRVQPPITTDIIQIKSDGPTVIPKY
ncbi:MAG: glycosyltransferase family 2 protein [Anaerolineae bacterium]|nr:glycosyltransferase family 2 protein [Anaerolineae bacterium]